LVNKPAFNLNDSKQKTVPTVSLPYTPIDCADYDYIEIACLYGYRVDVVLASSTLRGKAITTEKNANGEFLILQDEQQEQKKIRADEIHQLIVLDKQAKFNSHTFKRASG